MARDGEHRACTFLDADHAWVIGLVGEVPDRKIMIYRTADGGVTWNSSVLGGDHYTDWPVAPRAELTFQDPLNGRLTTIDPPVHHNGHVETSITYATADGGRTWRRVGSNRQSFEKSGGPG